MAPAPSGEPASPPLLTVEELRLRYGPEQPLVLDEVSLAMEVGETLAIVGESGSGKSSFALALTRLLPQRAELTGKVHFEGQSLLNLSERELRRVRGSRIGFIFQEPGRAFNPVFPIGWQLEEILRTHCPDTKDRTSRVIEALEDVGIRDAASRLRAYPDEFSGGMLQRALLAQTLLPEPSLLIADEPTTALDVTIQARVMELLTRIREERRLAVLLITHNFGLVHGFADRVVVLHEGRIVEQGKTTDVLTCPQHPYTRGLLACVPKLGNRRHRLPDLREVSNSS